MNQNKVEIVSAKMSRLNTDILGISKLKWTGTSEFISESFRTSIAVKKNHKRN